MAHADLVPLENSMKRRLRERLRELEPRIHVFAQAAGLGNPGIDYVVCAAGRLVAIEVKRTPRFALTTRQAATMNKIRGAGGLTFVVNNTTSMNMCIEEIRRIVNAATDRA